jgi:hypothetical protein
MFLVLAREPLLPVLPVGVLVLDAGHRDGHAVVRVGPGVVEGGDAADLAEGVLGRARAEGVGGDEFLGAGVELELVPGHAEVGVPAHGAVADPRHQARRGLDEPPHAPAVAAAGVHHLGVGEHCVIREPFGSWLVAVGPVLL